MVEVSNGCKNSYFTTASLAVEGGGKTPILPVRDLYF